MTGQSLHATHHHEHKAGAHVFDYARGFGNTAKEGLKRTTWWAAHYFTNKKSYYLCHPILLAFGTSQFCHLYQLFRWNQERMRERTHERMGAQQRKKCTSKDCSTRNHQVQGRHSPLNMYERKQPIGYKIQSLLPMINETLLDEPCPNCAGDHNENQVKPGDE